MNMNNVIPGNGVELRKRTILHLDVSLTDTESLILNLVLKREDNKISFEFDDCFLPMNIPEELFIKLKHLLLHDGETRNKFIGIVTARKLMKMCKINIFDDFPYVIFTIDIGNFNSKVRVHSNEVKEYLKIENLDIEEK